MPLSSLKVIRCPPPLRAEALALVLGDLPPSQRREIANSLLQVEDAADLANEALYVALRGEQVRGAAWGQRQPGNIAVFWPPQVTGSHDPRIAEILAENVTRALDETAIVMSQVLLPAVDSQTVQLLTHVDFRHLADLLYLSCEAEQFPTTRPEPLDLQFEPYSAAQRRRLMGLVDRTYEGTLDCTSLNGVRDLDDVINGYQATGTFRPENWQFIQAAGADVGVLLVADHDQHGHRELMYMGIVPEVRGRGWGRQIARFAQWQARTAGVERIVVAVDASNSPAVAMYRMTGFEIWDRRAVYLRFPPHRADEG
jgi:ribosomal protein S18 acetylase RimI-like enzyme